VCLVAAPVAAAVGTAVHDSWAQTYAQQAQDRLPLRHRRRHRRFAGSTKVITVRARWSANGITHVGNAQARPGAKVGNRIDVWFDNAGRQVKAPTPVAHPYRDVDGSV
jgi:hypothetical protein